MSLLTSLVAYYKLSDNTDATGGTSLTATGSPSYSAGKIGNAVDFGSANTTKNLYRTPAILSYNDLGTAWTFNYWFKITTGSVFQYLTRFILHNGANERNVTFELTTGNLPEVSAFDGSVHVVQSPTALSTGTWYMFTARYSSGVMYLYINGVQKASVSFSWSGYARTAYSNFSIGAEQLTAGGSLAVPFSGLIDEYGVWGRALTTDEITELYNSGNGLQYPFSSPTNASLLLSLI